MGSRGERQHEGEERKELFMDATQCAVRAKIRSFTAGHIREWRVVEKHNQVCIFGILCFLEAWEEVQVWMES